MRFDSSGFAELALRVLASCALFVSAPAGAPSAAAEESQSWSAEEALATSPAPPGLRLVWDETAQDPRGTLDRLENAGFHVAVALPPHIYYVLEDHRPGAFLPAGCLFRDAPRASAETSASLPGSSAVTMAGISEAEEDPFQGRGDAFPPAPSSARISGARIGAAPSTQGLPYGARWTDTSEFMIGRVAVSILFPESDGTIDPNRFDWTPALRDSVIRSAVRGLAGWSVFGAARGVPVSFAIEVHAGLATRYEPIDRTVSEEENWMADVLTAYTGHRSDALTLAYEVANASRARLGAQWCALIYAVQNDTDQDGTFPDGFISHAKLGGPWFVTPVNNLNTQSASLDFYIRHEMAHMFWALDEHFPSNGWWACQLATGYFNQPNLNSVVPAPGYCGYRRGCLMYANQPDSLCEYTARHVGWADRDATGRPDLLETRAAAHPDSTEYHTTAGSPIVLRGQAVEAALWNQNPYHYFIGDTISAASIDSLVYRVDGGPWLHATPLDGAFDSGSEGFTATIPPLPPGQYLVEWVAWNSNGLPSQENGTTILFLSAPTGPPAAGAGQPGSPALSLRSGPSPSFGPVRIHLSARPGSSGWGRIHDVHGREVARWRLAVPESGIEDWTWGARLAGGGALPSGLYFLSVEIDGTVLRRRLVISR